MAKMKQLKVMQFAVSSLDRSCSLLASFFLLLLIKSFISFALSLASNHISIFIYFPSCLVIAECSEAVYLCAS